MTASRLVVDGCAIATVDERGTEHAAGHLVVEDGRLRAVGSGPAPGFDDDVPTRRVDGSGCLAVPGLVNCHHHLYQWATRGLVQQGNLFEWLTELYPIWARIDESTVHAAARAGLASLALSGCTLSTDHHYVFPDGAGDLLLAEIEAARSVGLRFHPCRGSMDLGRRHGGLPPDSVIQDRDVILRQTDEAIARHHDPSPDAMLQIAVAPCTAFTASAELLRESAELARRRGVRLHTHLAETVEEEAYCLERFGARPLEYLEDLGWIGEDVWMAHSIHLGDREVRRLGETRTGIAHCPTSNARLGAGTAPIVPLLRAGSPVGLGVDGAASNEDGRLDTEVRNALRVARLRDDAKAMTARDALALGTIHGARCLGRSADLGSLEPGKLADVALWRLDRLGHAGIVDPVAALVLGPPAPLELLLVAGRPVVERNELLTASEDEIARELTRAARTLQAPGVGE